MLIQKRLTRYGFTTNKTRKPCQSCDVKSETISELQNDLASANERLSATNTRNIQLQRYIELLRISHRKQWKELQRSKDYICRLEHYLDTKDLENLRLELDLDLERVAKVGEEYQQEPKEPNTKGKSKGKELVKANATGNAPPSEPCLKCLLKDATITDLEETVTLQKSFSILKSALYQDQVKLKKLNLDFNMRFMSGHRVFLAGHLRMPIIPAPPKQDIYSVQVLALMVGSKRKHSYFDWDEDYYPRKRRRGSLTDAEDVWPLQKQLRLPYRASLLSAEAEGTMERHKVNTAAENLRNEVAELWQTCLTSVKAKREAVQQLQALRKRNGEIDRGNLKVLLQIAAWMENNNAIVQNLLRGFEIKVRNLKLIIVVLKDMVATAAESLEDGRLGLEAANAEIARLKERPETVDSLCSPDEAIEGPGEEKVKECEECKVNLRALEGAQKTIELQEPLVDIAKDIRLRHLTRHLPLDTNTQERSAGNIAAHNGNILVDVNLFKLDKLNVWEHGDFFEGLYDIAINDILDKDSKESEFVKFKFICSVLSWRANLRSRGSFTPKTLSKGDDDKFTSLYRRMMEKIKQTDDLRELQRFSRNPDIKKLYEEMKGISTRIVKLDWEQRRESGGF
ncbi:hypothetical protein B0J14DRAFT_647830 [Halenospora varia]|nr:hypothetical protein B0J14DRAFT_647830 [Halenospora varia]